MDLVSGDAELHDEVVAAPPADAVQDLQGETRPLLRRPAVVVAARRFVRGLMNWAIMFP